MVAFLCYAATLQDFWIVQQLEEFKGLAMQYTGCDGEKYIKFDQDQWLVIYCLKDSEEVKARAWPSSVDKELLKTHYQDRPDVDLLLVERVGVLLVSHRVVSADAVKCSCTSAWCVNSTCPKHGLEQDSNWKP